MLQRSRHTMIIMCPTNKDRTRRLNKHTGERVCYANLVILCLWADLCVNHLSRCKIMLILNVVPSLHKNVQLPFLEGIPPGFSTRINQNVNVISSLLLIYAANTVSIEVRLWWMF